MKNITPSDDLVQDLNTLNAATLIAVEIEWALDRKRRDTRPRIAPVAFWKESSVDRFLTARARQKEEKREIHALLHAFTRRVH